MSAPRHLRMVHTMLQDAAPLPGLYCEDLPPGQAGTVFPLLREAIPGLQLPSWLRFARRVTSPRRAGQSGIMVVRRAPRPMPCGLFLWRRDEDLTHGAVLVAEHLIAIDLLDTEPVMAALHTQIRGCPPPPRLPEAGHFVPEHGKRIAELALRHFSPPA